MAYKKVIPAFYPRFRWQLGRGTPQEDKMDGSEDCSVRGFQHMVGRLTKDNASPWVDLIREWTGRKGASSLWDYQRACKRMDSWLAKRGRKPIRAYLKFTKDAAVNAVHNGKMVGLAIDYGTFNDIMGKTGDPAYRGGHFVAVQGEKKWSNGTVVWCLYDSLDDNRRNSIPQGYRWVPRSKVLKAAKAWATRTNGTEVTAIVLRGGGKL